MTLVEVFRCRACHFEQGPFGTHGFDPETRNGELMGACPNCRMLAVVRVVGGEFQSACYACQTPFRFHDGSCPKCGSRDCGFAWAGFLERAPVAPGRPPR